MKTKGTLTFDVTTNGKQKGNKGVAWEPMENAKETQELRRNL